MAMDSVKTKYRKIKNKYTAKGDHTNGNGQHKDQVQKNKKTNCCKRSLNKWQWTVQRSSTERLQNKCAAKKITQMAMNSAKFK